MARRSRSRTANANGRTRSHYSAIANRRLSLPIVELRPIDLRVFEDRRQYDPARHLHYPTRVKLGGSLPARVVERPRSFNSFGMSFVTPKAVAVCVRRKQRREVILAKGGGASRARKRRNEWSKIKC